MKRLIFFFSIGCFFVNAQMLKDPHCATMERDSILRVKFPQRGRLQDFEDALQLKIKELRDQNKNGRTMAGVVHLPIIVHVVNNGEAVGTGTNISQAQVQAQIAVLNEDFRRVFGTPGYNTNPVGADIEIEFCLSPVGENGEPLEEPGIDRYNGGRSDWSQEQIENQLKPNTIWNTNLFYNIWTVKFAASDANLLGYAQFPDQSGLTGLPASGPASTDGVVIRYQSFGSADKGNFPVMVAPYNKGRTLTHETGHWLGLRHIWGDGACADDFVSDTPPQQSASSGCQVGRFSCNNTNMVENYMDYSNDACMNIFTEGQKARIQAVIAISPRRKTLVDANLCSPPVADVPTANFNVDNQFVLLGGEAIFTDLSTNFPNEWSWTFEGGDPSTSTDRNPKIKYSNPGTYKVSLVAKNSLGSSALLELANYITVSDQGLCGTVNNFKDTYTPSTIRLSQFGNYKGFLAGHNGLKSKAVSEFFKNSLGYRYISGVSLRFSKAYTLKEDATVNVVVWNARGAQNAPGSVIERKVVLFKQIQDDIANNQPTTIVFDRETPVFSKPYQVGIELTYSGDSLALVSSANGEALDATSWIQDKDGHWKPMAIAFGANVAMDIEPIVGMKASVQVSASTPLAYPGQEVVMNGRGASIFIWNSDNGSVANFTGPQLIVNPTETTTYTTTGTGLELCNDVALTTIYVSDKITKVDEPGFRDQLQLYPNPGSNFFNVSLESSYVGPIALSLYDVHGKAIANLEFYKSSPVVVKPIELSIAPGLYLTRITYGKKVIVAKWISK